jgi:hypothetical protein
MSAFDYLGVTLIVINTALFLVVFASVPMGIKRGVGVAPSLVYLLTTAATVVWMWRSLAWQA